MLTIEVPEKIVVSAHKELFTQHDLLALDRYFSEDFIEHSPLIESGKLGLKALIQQHPHLHHQAHRVLVDKDLIAIHGRFTGWGDHALVGFDLYRVKNNKIVEHWQGLVPEAPPNASGRTQLDGPTDPGIGHDIEKNRAIVKEFFSRTLIDGDYSGFRKYTDGKHFLQHSPDIADGVEQVIDFLNQLKANHQGLEYECLHQTIADGQFVLTQSEGKIAGVPHAYFELWRLHQGQIVELWDAIMPISENKK